LYPHLTTPFPKQCLPLWDVTIM